MHEKWSVVAKKEKNCDEEDPQDQYRGDRGDHVAFGAAHRLVLAVIPGEGTVETVQDLVADVKERRGAGRRRGNITPMEAQPIASSGCGSID